MLEHEVEFQDMDLKTELLVDTSKLFGMGYALLQLPDGHAEFKDME